MRWSDIDTDQNVWLLKAEQTKAGRPHEVALNAHALEIRTLTCLDQTLSSSKSYSEAVGYF